MNKFYNEVNILLCQIKNIALTEYCLMTHPILGIE